VTERPATATPARPTVSVAKAAMAIGAVTVAARLVGFARGLVFVRTVGATCVGDTYFAANTVPNIVFEVVAGGALASVIVPVLAGPVAAGDTGTVRRIASALLGWAVVLLAPVAVLGVLLARPLMGALTGPSLAAYDRASVVALGARMLVVFMPQVVLYGVGIVLAGLLQAHRRFLGPALAPLLSSLVVIGVYAGYAATPGSSATGCAGVSTTRLLVLCLGTTLGVAVLSLSLLVPLRGAGLRLRPMFGFPPGVAARVRGLALAGVAALAAQQCATAVVLRLGYGGPSGTLVLYTLAWTVFLLPWAVLAVPVATSVFPGLSARADVGDDAGFAADTATSTRAVVLLTAGAGAALVAVALPLARLLVLHATGHPDPTVLARGFVAFAPGLCGYGLVALLGRVLYARSEGRSAAVATVVGWATVVVADLVLGTALPRGERLTALGVGNSVGMTVAGALLLAAVVRTSGRTGVDGVLRAGCAAAAGAAAAATAGSALATALPGSGVPAALWQAALTGAVALALFAATVAVLDRPDLAMLRRRVARHG
jgi:putative peptidoglycan lipid II flippase